MKSLKHQQRCELRAVKDDLWSSSPTLSSLPEYHAFIHQHRPHVVPVSLRGTQYNPETVSSALKMKNLGEWQFVLLYLGKHMQSHGITVFPLRKQMMPSFVKLDRACIIRMCNLSANTYVDDSQIWAEVFRMNRKTFARKGYDFAQFSLTSPSFQSTMLSFI